MKTIFGPSKLKKPLADTVVVIGVFDGLHQGHRYLIHKAVATAQKLKVKSVCVTFHPHPQGQPYLISLKHRLKLIAGLGIDYCVVIPFNKKFAHRKPESFVEDILVKLFHPVYIFIGKHFRFGYKAGGDVRLLASVGHQYGFKVSPVQELTICGRKASSQRIRMLISSGRLLQAEKILGRRVSVLGTVIKGSHRGRVLGYPTANINPHHEVLPKEGIYAVMVVYKSKEYKGLCYIGRRPTFSVSEEAKTIEAHLFDFNKNIYGQDLEIQFIHKIRSERKFSSSISLISQIKKDQLVARQLLARLAS